MEMLLIRCPRLIWANINEDDNFLAPLNFPCLTAVLKQYNVPVQVKTLDCCAEKMGWKSLDEYLRTHRYDVVGIGDETFNVAGGLRALEMVRKYHPDTITIAGGRHFSYTIDQTFGATDLIDYIVVGEGELTFLELIQELMKPSADRRLDQVRGIAYRNEDGTAVRTPLRPIIEDLDTLPLPDYDSIPINLYGTNSKLNPNSITYFHSRGCTFGCDFCTFWPLESDHKLVDGKDVFIPRYRTKSAELCVDEIETIVKKYKKDYIYFADGSFDIDPEWNDKFAEGILKRGLKINWWCYGRADNILRDEKLGIFEKLVRAGYAHSLIGAERMEDEDLISLHKPGDYGRKTKEVMQLFDRKYPMLVKHVTFLGGMPEDTPEKLNRLYKFAVGMKLDICTLLFITPMPGTKYYNELEKKGLIKVRDFTKYSWFEPINEIKGMGLQEFDQFWTRKILLANFHNILWRIKRFFSPYESIKRVNRYGSMMGFRYLKALLKDPFNRRKRFRGMSEPEWYDS